jgi:enoyl-CoA hydratase/carnithine racemase
MKALSTELRGDVLYITIDTPSCSVNIFTHDAALQLTAILNALDPGVRALVIRSGKPHSFINGASLMLASAIGKPEDLPRLTAPIRQAYQAIGDLEIPTVAAVRGSCYGCGVELTLRCKYRVAADAYDAHFFMTELADYLLVPTFGSTQLLPHMLGMEGAADFLLWGERWSAREALARGLTQACLSDDDFDSAVERIASDLASTGASPLLGKDAPRRPANPEALRRGTRHRIQRLPPAYRDVYSTCYALMERAAAKDRPEPSDFEAEMLASGRSIMAPIAKASIGFFFLRQSNEQLSTRGVAERPSLQVACDETAEGPRWVREELKRRRVRGVRFEDLSAVPPESDALRLVSYAKGQPPFSVPHALAVNDSLDPGPLDPPRAPVVLHAPAWRRGTPFVEIACSQPKSEDGANAYRLLAKGGIPSVLTRPKREFMTNALLRSYLKPQVAFVAANGSPVDAAATLLHFGFTRLPCEWLSGWTLDDLALLVSDGDGQDTQTRTAIATLVAIGVVRHVPEGTPSPALEAAVLASLLAFARRTLGDGTAGHPSVIDVAARELIDFPIGHTSLCRYLTLGRAREMRDREAAIAPFVSDAVLTSLHEHVAAGRDFYR